MTSYLLGEIDPKTLSWNSDHNSFRPSFIHYFEESYPPTYLPEYREGNMGQDTLVYYDVGRCVYITQKEEVEKIYNMLNRDNKK